MKHAKEIETLSNHIKNKGLRNSDTRLKILLEFLNANKHLTAEDLYSIVHKKFSTIGIATIYRNLHLFCESGVAKEMKLDDSISRYEPVMGYEHHDHLICTKCGAFIEVCDDYIEKLQEELAIKNGFILKSHKMELYGICSKCQ